MDWKWNSSSHPISDIRDWNNAKRLEIRPDFQRKEVWSESAKIMLMDTILKNILMPKIFLKAIIRNSDTYRIIIDGQQRIKAILAFLRGDFKLAKPYEGKYENCSFEELPPNIKDDFLSYKIDLNEIINASDDIVREIYSRVNKYNIALNKQELRRADFPGDFLDLSEKLSLHDFFEDGKVFTGANRRRMGDVEYISELLAVLIDGVQDKKDTLDQFYQDYSHWETDEINVIEKQFQEILDDILLIFPKDSFPISQTRFKQKADFYCLFAAIHDLHVDEFSLQNKNVDDLQKDLEILNYNITPESEVPIFSEYAIKCVSQGNTIISRKWRKDFLKHFLKGTYAVQPPDDETIKIFFNIFSDNTQSSMCKIIEECIVCNDTIEDKDYNENNIALSWHKPVKEFQLSNAKFGHLNCLIKSDKFIYGTGNKES